MEPPRNCFLCLVRIHNIYHDLKNQRKKIIFPVRSTKTIMDLSFYSPLASALIGYVISFRSSSFRSFRMRVHSLATSLLFDPVLSDLSECECIHWLRHFFSIQLHFYNPCLNNLCHLEVAQVRELRGSDLDDTYLWLQKREANETGHAIAAAS